MNPIRVRFCPSPTGMPHVGNIRTALFNYAFAKHNKGTFILRIEDTDPNRSTSESYKAIIDSLKWLGFNWDEGPEMGGKYGPYLQSERYEIYQDILQKLITAGYVYQSFSTVAEVEARHLAAGRSPKLGYDNFDRKLTKTQINNYLSEGRNYVLRFKMPDTDCHWQDLIRGKVEFKSENIPDFALTRANGDPLYTLVNPVDDALMRISHVLRGEDLLSSTPRQLALHKALIELKISHFLPEFGHLPFVMGNGNKKLSKRDPEANFLTYIQLGYLPEGVINYLALLGWSLSADQDVFSLSQMISAFNIKNVNANPARFDSKKADAINAAHIRLLTVSEFADRLKNYLLDNEYISAKDKQLKNINTIAELLQTRIVVLADAWPLINYLFNTELALELNSAAVEKFLNADSVSILETGIINLENINESNWNTDTISGILKAELIKTQQLKPKLAFGVIRVAITGSHISLPLFESMALLGKKLCMTRLAKALEISKIQSS